MDPNQVMEMACPYCRRRSLSRAGHAGVVLLLCSEVRFGTSLPLWCCSSMRSTCLFKCFWEMEVSFGLDISLDSDWAIQEVHTDVSTLIIAVVNGN